jgi:hypothetical protein
LLGMDAMLGFVWRFGVMAGEGLPKYAQGLK